jgi:hypothetical protein
LARRRRGPRRRSVDNAFPRGEHLQFLTELGQVDVLPGDEVPSEIDRVVRPELVKVARALPATLDDLVLAFRCPVDALQ